MLSTIPGVHAVERWFGEWPSFHDAEIQAVYIDRERQLSALRVRTWIRSGRIDETGYFVREREATVVFEFSGIAWVRLEGEDADTQNVISGLSIDLTPGGYRIELAPGYGLHGHIVAKDLKVSVEP